MVPVLTQEPGENREDGAAFGALKPPARASEVPRFRAEGSGKPARRQRLGAKTAQDKTRMRESVRKTDGPARERGWRAFRIDKRINNQKQVDGIPIAASPPHPRGGLGAPDGMPTARVMRASNPTMRGKSPAEAASGPDEGGNRPFEPCGRGRGQASARSPHEAK